MKNYHLNLTNRFKKEFRKLDRYTQKMIRGWIDKNLIGTSNHRIHGKNLTANRSGQWRYRIAGYRLICQIEDDKLIILALTVGYQREIYSK